MKCFAADQPDYRRAVVVEEEVAVVSVMWAEEPWVNESGTTCPCVLR